MQRKLLVWDIDGTLVEKRHGADQEFSKAVRKALGLAAVDTPEQSDGDTDFAVVEGMLEKLGLSNEEKLAVRPRVFAALTEVSCDHDYLRARRSPLPGARETLARAAAFDLLQTVGTGNTPERGQAKIEAMGLGQHLELSIGGFGDWTPDRAEMVGRIRELAALAYGHQYPGDQMIVIGDTPKDIEAAREVGARSVAVATGRFSAAQLEDFEPDLLLVNLEGDPLSQILEI